MKLLDKIKQYGRVAKLIFREFFFGESTALAGIPKGTVIEIFTMMGIFMIPGPKVIPPSVLAPLRMAVVKVITILLNEKTKFKHHATVRSNEVIFGICIALALLCTVLVYGFGINLPVMLIMAVINLFSTFIVGL